MRKEALHYIKTDILRYGCTLIFKTARIDNVRKTAYDFFPSVFFPENHKLWTFVRTASMSGSVESRSASQPAFRYTSVLRPTSV